MSSSLTVDKALLEKYRTSAPRYTSYPTAVDWSSDFDPEGYPERLQRSAAREDALSVYLHLPFCPELCLFCGCNVVITRNGDRRPSPTRPASSWESFTLTSSTKGR